MTKTQLIDKIIRIIQKHTRTEALGSYNCALKNHYPLDYEKCINEIAELIKN
ncbi:unnamed protein product [marine sediment metagenome]|uniref:Uncharacterized protein n=1 Tax=marine sediment metagenome TaxID=412755 RepID=X0ZID5_9ZZZZ